MSKPTFAGNVLWAAAFGLLAMSWGCAQPANDKEGAVVDKKAKTKTVTADESFAKEAAAAGIAEVELGKLALERAGSDEVRKFAQHMVEDHGKANKELQELAKQKQIALPEQPDPKRQKVLERLSELKGAKFDEAYMQNQVEEHQEAVRLFENQAKNGKDADLKSFAAKTLPTLREHLKMAQSVADQKGGKE